MFAVRPIGLVSLLLLLPHALSSARATVPPFMVDTSVSQLSFTGSIVRPGYSTSPLMPVVTGAANTAYGGGLEARRSLNPLSFRGGNVDAIVKGTYQPGPAPANYGLTASLPAPIGNIMASIRDFSFELDGDTIAISSGYDISSVNVRATSGTFVSDKLPTVYLTGANAVSIYGTATVTTPSLIEQHLRLPIGVAFREPIPGTDYELNFSLVGLIQASRTLPEPSTALLVVVGAGAALRRRRPVR
jgi:hypothetical protein